MESRRQIRIGAGAALVLLLLAAQASAAVPAGPRLAISQLGPSLSSKIFTIGPAGTDRQIVMSGPGKRGPALVGGATWSPDGSRLVVDGIVALESTKQGIPKQLYLLPADGGKPRPVKGTAGAADPVFAPDGHTVAFAKDKFVIKWGKKKLRFYSSTSIWLVDLDTGKARQLTPWRDGLERIPSSFSPDGSVLAGTRTVNEKRPEAIGIHLDGSGTSVLVPGSASEPVFSPDGTRIAFLRGPTRGVEKKHDIYAFSLGGGELRRLTKTPALREYQPSWDPSGQRLAYMAMGIASSVREALGASPRVRMINADGTCATDLFYSNRVIFSGPAWQPGPGREAGPISC